jgi:hypothetical protein
MSNNYEYIVFNLLYNCFVFSAIIVFNGHIISYWKMILCLFLVTKAHDSYIYGMTFQHLLSQVRLMDANSPLFKSKHYFNIGDRKQNIITCRLRNEASYHNGL